MLLVLVSLALVAILVPFWSTILWRAIIALRFSPLHRRRLPRMIGRRTPAALYTGMQATELSLAVITLGGMSVFAINGFLLRPIIATLSFAAWSITGAGRSQNERP